MALPVTFGPLTAASMGQLDQDFAAVGALTTLACTATGTNAIVLTPAANQPTVNGYGLPNPLKFGFTAPAATTGAVTLEVLALGFLPVFVPSGAQATSGTLQSGQYYEVTYTTGASYNSGNGAWVLSSFQPATGITVAGNASAAGLKVANNAATPSTKVDISFTSAALVSAAGVPVFVGRLSATIDLTTGTVTAAANGMDGESRPASGWVYIYAISTGSGMSGLASLSSPLTAAPTLPAGFTFYAYLGAMFCDGSSNLLRSQQLGPATQYTVVASSNTSRVPLLASGMAGTASVTSPAAAAVSVATFVPPTAGAINVLAASNWGGGSVTNVLAAPNAAYFGTNNGPAGSNGMLWPVALIPVTGSEPTQSTIMVLEGTSIQWASGGANGALACLGWSDYVSAAN